MRSMFNSAPFARFDLGRHALAEICGPGTVPMLVNGQVVCVKGSHPSGMFTGPGDGRGVGYGAAMGQMQEPYLTQAERDKLLGDIRKAVGQTRTIDDLLIWSGENDPGLKQYLGMDASRFSALNSSIGPLYPTVRDLGERLAQTDAEYWYRPSDQELAQVKQWVTGISEMTKLIDKRRGQPYKAPPGTVSPPTSVTQAAPAAGTGDAVSAQDILVGGVVAVGLGLLLSTLL